MHGLNVHSTRSMAWRSSWFRQRMQLSNLGKVKCSVYGSAPFILLLAARRGCHCINLYCL
ncbi:hypothetical protein K492DRAFT_175006, partial [Lichtheimia hyalospora FSU 10163]